MSTLPPVVSIRRDQIGREIRLELADWRTRSGGIYDLPATDWDDLALPSYLPPYHLFVPDFVIVYATGTARPDRSPDWNDLRVHVGGMPLAYASDPDVRRSFTQALATDWHDLASLLRGRPTQDAAPDWLLDLIAAQTPFGDLLADRTTRSVDA